MYPLGAAAILVFNRLSRQDIRLKVAPIIRMTAIAVCAAFIAAVSLPQTRCCALLPLSLQSQIIT